MFKFIWTVTFLAFGVIHMTCECSISLSPTIPALRNTRVYVGSSYSHNMPS